MNIKSECTDRQETPCEEVAPEVLVVSLSDDEEACEVFYQVCKAVRALGITPDYENNNFLVYGDPTLLAQCQTEILGEYANKTSYHQEF